MRRSPALNPIALAVEHFPEIWYNSRYDRRDDEGQEIREQISNGLRELHHQLSRLTEDVQSSETYRDVQKRVKKAIESPQVEEAARSIEHELDEALSALNNLLNKLIQSVPGPKSRKE